MIVLGGDKVPTAVHPALGVGDALLLLCIPGIGGVASLIRVPVN